MGITHRWILAAAAVVGIALLILTYGPGNEAPEPPHPAVAPASPTPTPTPTETWRPANKVDWKKHPPRTQARIDAYGAAHDCDQLAALLDTAKDPALVLYLEAWFDHSGRCVDVYVYRQPRK